MLIKINSLDKQIKKEDLEKFTRHNVRFNAQEQVRRYHMVLELSDKEDELEELENLNLREVN